MTKEEFNAMAKRFLSIWDCTIGQPKTKPNWAMPFRYERGDYFIVSDAYPSVRDDSLAYDMSLHYDEGDVAVYNGELIRFEKPCYGGEVSPKDLPIVHNQRPCGTEFTDTDRDHEEETDLVLPNDCYIFNGERWILHHRSMQDTLEKILGIPMVDC